MVILRSALVLAALSALTGCALGSSVGSAAPSSGVAPAVSASAAVRGELSGPHEVVSVVDGDTVKLRVDGKLETLRLIGLDTPETKDPRKPVQCFGAEASARASELLLGKALMLELDPSQDSRDRYGRLLGYLRVDGALFNQIMIAEGFALEYTYEVPYLYQAEFRRAQAEAERKGAGLWAAHTCAGDPSKPA